MSYYRMKTGGMVHMRGHKLPAPCCAPLQIDGKQVVCMTPSAFLCDGPGQGSKTCDRALCEAHATQTGPDRHLCPACRTASLDAAGQRSLFTHLISQ